MKRATLLPLLFLACSHATAPERYGFVTVLGNDTVAVERVERSPTRLVTDGVDRWPFVRQRHTEFDLNDDGTIHHMVMDVRTPNGPSPRERGRRVTADFSRNAVKISVRDSAGVRDTSFNTGGAITVPHVSMMYSVIELEIAAAIRRASATGLAPGDSVLFRQFYPDRDVGPSFTLHRGFVHPLDGGKVELRHDWLAGTGDVTVDSSGRMLTYSGMRSTYKVAVTRTTTLPDVESVADGLAAAEQRTGQAQLSVRDTTRATIGTATFSVDYGRPLARGRTLLGNVIGYDRVWRTGANAATQFTTSAPITLAGLSLPAGTYTLWTVPRARGADLIVNKQTGQWGTEYRHAQDLGMAPMKSDSVATPVEKFTISIETSDAGHGTLTMAWGTFRWTAPIVVSPSASSRGEKTSAVPDTLAEQLLAGARRALGDVTRVRSLTAIAAVTGPSSSFQSVVYSARDGRARLALGSQFLAGIGKTRGWVYDPKADSVGLLDDATRSVVQGHELHMLVLAPTTRWGRPVARGRQSWAGVAALAVEFRDRLGAPAVLYLRARDSLPIGLRLVNHTGQGPPDVDVTFARWEAIEGVRLFRHAVFSQGDVRYVYQYRELRLNAVPDSMFEPRS